MNLDVHTDAADWTKSDLLRAVNHGLQREALGRIRDRLAELRAAKTWRQYHDFQNELLDDLLWAQEYQRRSRDNLRLKRKGGSPEAEAETGSWELDFRIARRVERQIRSVGDCLAWRLLDCKRHVFWILSANDSPGLMYGKEGFRAERRKVEEYWAAGQFALLMDMTQSLRIGDLMICTSDGRRFLDEVKTSGRGPTGKQRERMQKALDTLNRRRPLEVRGEVHELFEAETQMKTCLADLRNALLAAKANGVGSATIDDGWSVMAVSLLAKTQPQDPTEDSWRLLNSRLLLDSGVSASAHALRSVWTWRLWDVPDVLVGRPPFGAYPFEPELCAELTCGYSMFQTHIAPKLLSRPLEAHGFKVTWNLPSANSEIDPAVDLLSVSKPMPGGARRVGVPGSALSDVFYEFLEPQRFASAFDEMFDWSFASLPAGRAPQPEELSRQIGKATLALANEKAIWFKRPHA